MTVSPNSDRNPYHLELTDGSATVGLILCDRNGNENPRAFMRTPIPRSSLKIYQGEQKNSDLEPPWTDVVQEDWGGGHGGEVFDDDSTRYWDGYRIDSTRGYLVRGPMETFAKGVRVWCGYWETNGAPSYYGVPAPLTMYSYSIYGATRYIATKFVASATFTPASVWLYARVNGRVLIGPTIQIVTDSSGSPTGTVVATGQITSLDTNIGTYLVNIAELSFVAPATQLTYGSTYWIVVSAYTGDDVTNHFDIVMASNTANTAMVSMTSADALTWSGAAPLDGQSILFRLTDAEKPFRAHFAILKNSMYAGLEYLDGSDSVVYMNGTGGTATAGGTTYLRDANNAFITDDQFNGAMIYLWDGSGSNVYRSIKDTKTADSQIDVMNWGITPDTTTKYSVLDTERFTSAIGVAASTGKRITDVTQANGALYWAMGDGATAYIRRLRHHWTSGSPGTYFNWTDEATSGTLIRTMSDRREVQLWLANRSLPGTLKRATAPDCTGTAAVTSASWTTLTSPGDKEIKTTGLEVYGEGFPRMHVLKENAIIEYVGDEPQELRIAALRNVRDGWNGIAHCVNDVYLYWSFIDRVQRYYSGQLDDIGPDLHADRRGKIMALVAYPGRLYAAIDGGPYNYSTIQCYNGRGWCEIYRAPIIGLRIMNAFIQPIPGPYNADRLWFSCGSDIVSLPLALDPYRHNEDVGYATSHTYAFSPSGSLETGWYFLGLRQINKLFNKIQLVKNGDSSADVAIFYKTDGSWTLLDPVSFAASVAGAYLDDSTHNLTAVKLKFKFVISNFDASTDESEKIVASILEALVTVPHKYQTTITFRLEDNAETMQINGIDTYTDADTKFAQLDTWASSAGTVGLTSHIDLMNNKRVKIDAASVQLLRHEVSEINGRKRNKYLCQASLIEVD